MHLIVDTDVVIPPGDFKLSPNKTRAAAKTAGEEWKQMIHQKIGRRKNTNLEAKLKSARWYV